jgi:hypothetical protein
MEHRTPFDKPFDRLRRNLRLYSGRGFDTLLERMN